MKISPYTTNVCLLTFLVLLGLGSMHWYPNEGREMFRDGFIALLAILTNRDKPTTAA